MTSAWGIDLGTTNSVIARLVDGQPAAVAVDEALAIVPSVVLFEDDGSVVVGRAAMNLELARPERVVRSAKRRIGGTEPYRLPGGRSVLPEEVSAEVLRALKRGAEASTGEAVRDAVITVPAYFDDAQRRATLKAGELAGLNVLRLLNEPTSASLVYQAAGLAKDRPRTVLVYDLGGGTFDVSVLEVFESVREVRATAGNSHLGGDDFDEIVVRTFVDALRAQGADLQGDARAAAVLRRLAESTKIRLSSETEVRVREEFVATGGGAPVHLDLTLTRRQLEERIEPLLASTIELALRAVKDAGLAPDAIDAICLVGGSTRIPRVRALLADAFAAEVHEEVDPDLAVGLGAAVQAGMLAGAPVDRILVDVAAHTLGVRVLGALDDGYGEPDTFAPVMRRNTALPAERAEEFYTMVDDQPAIEVVVFQGEGARCSENTRVGAFRFPLLPAPSHAPVCFHFAYDLDGIVRVRVAQVGTDNEKTVAMSLPDASERGPVAPGGGDAPPGAVERRAQQLLDAPGFPRADELRGLLARFRAASGAERTAVEEELLDFFLDVEAA